MVPVAESAEDPPEEPEIVGTEVGRLVRTCDGAVVGALCDAAAVGPRFNGTVLAAGAGPSSTDVLPDIPEEEPDFVGIDVTVGSNVVVGSNVSDGVGLDVLVGSNVVVGSNVFAGAVVGS